MFFKKNEILSPQYIHSYFIGHVRKVVEQRLQLLHQRLAKLRQIRFKQLQEFVSRILEAVQYRLNFI